MFRHLIKQGILGFALFSFLSSLNIAVAASQDELTKNFSLAQNLAQKGEVDQAIAVYTSLIKINPQLPEVYNNLAALYLQQKNTKQAKLILEQGLSAHKGYGSLYESLTAINVAMAREAYSKALQIELKPAEITIASLSLSSRKVISENNSIIIPEVTKLDNSSAAEPTPVVDTKKTESKPQLSAVISPSHATAIEKNISVQQLKNTKAIETVLQAWSAAWSAQAVDMYLSFYHSHYKPSNGLSRNGWEQSRRLKLKKPSWIKIGLSNFDVEKNNGRQAIVKFKQSYQSNRYSDVSSKRMVLLYTDNGWRIFQEKSI